MTDAHPLVPLRPRPSEPEVEVLDGPPPGWPRPSAVASARAVLGHFGRALLPRLPRASAAALVRVADGGRGALDRLGRAVAEAAMGLGHRAVGSADRAATATQRTLEDAGEVMERLRSRLGARRSPAPDPATGGSRPDPGAPTPPRAEVTSRAASVIAALRRRVEPGKGP